MLRFTDQSLREVLDQLQQALAGVRPGESLRFLAPDPDLARGHFAGELFERGALRLRARGLATWVGVAEVLRATLSTPRPAADSFVELALRALDPEASWHARAGDSGLREKYGQGDYMRIDKFEEPSFLTTFAQALRFLDPREDARILAVGAHRGAELAAVDAELSSPRMRFVGIDHCASAIAAARAAHRDPRFQFIEADLAEIGALGLGRFDLVLALNTLHSPGLDGRALLRSLIAEHLEDRAGVLLGFPNCRYLDHETLFGAKVRGYDHAELSLLLKDLSFHKRYLHQHGFRVTVTGKYTVLVTGRRCARTRSPTR